jgi:lipopolysaccharide exporter
VLGANWQEAAQFVALFSIVSMVQIFASPLTTLLTLRGLTQVQSRIVWLEFAAFLLAALALYPLAGLIGLALARIAAGLVSAAATVWAVRTTCGLGTRRVVAAVWRPLVGAVGVFALVEATLGWVAAPGAQVALAIGVGAVSFALWIGVTWQLLGRPEGLESTVYDHATAWWSGRSE